MYEIFEVRGKQYFLEAEDAAAMIQNLERLALVGHSKGTTVAVETVEAKAEEKASKRKVARKEAAKSAEAVADGESGS